MPPCAVSRLSLQGTAAAVTQRVRLWSSWADCEASVPDLACDFLAGWARRAACWSCEPEITAHLVGIAEHLVWASKQLWWSEEAAGPGALVWTRPCLPAATLAAFLLLRFALDKPYTPGVWDRMAEARISWDLAATRLLRALERAAGGGKAAFGEELFRRHGVTAMQLRYLQWQSRFKHIAAERDGRGERWSVRNASALEGFAGCGEPRLQQERSLAGRPFDVFDFGAGRGWDALFFARGARCRRVLALEADPESARWLRRLFRPLTAKGELEVLHVGIVGAGGEKVMRFCSHWRSEWSLPLERWEAPEGPDCREIAEVPTMSCADVASRFGLPELYWKMDIEKAELECLRSIRAALLESPSLRLPLYLSMEAPHTVGAIADAFDLLQDLGYLDFKLVSPKIFDTFVQPSRTALGIYSSGLFGEDAVDEVSGVLWRSSEAVKRDLLRCYVGAGRVEPAAASSRVPSNLSDGSTLRACPKWHAHFDIHVAHGARRW